MGIFPEGRLTDTGELNRFRPGVKEIVSREPVPVIPMAIRGLWGSFFARSHDGRVMRRWLGLFPRIELVAAPGIPPADATPERLQAAVSALRGDAR